MTTRWVQDPDSPVMRREEAPMSPEARTVDRCSELREACQKHIFAQIDVRREADRKEALERHEAVMEQLGEITEAMAYQRGQTNGRAGAVAGTGAQEPVAAGFSLPSLSSVLKIGLLIGALTAGIVGGCEYAKAQRPAVEKAGAEK